MNKMPLLKVIGSTVAMLLVAGSCWADASARGCDRSDGRAAGCIAKAPEIDAGAGSGAIALLVGGLLLAAEMRRRSS